MNESLTLPLLLEDVLASRENLGAQYLFERESIQISKNEFDVMGVFACRDYRKGSKIISLPIQSGSLTRNRAYEEALPLLKKLGVDRYNVGESFIISAALYLRHENGIDKGTDLMIPDPNLENKYHGLPMTAYGSLDRAKLLFDNDKIALDDAAKMDERLSILGVDKMVFRYFLAYCVSRRWGSFGIVPIFDWLNSAYKEQANCRFSVDGEHFSFIARRDIIAGEELVWDYNDSDARVTWLNYGYVDPRRPRHAFIELMVSEDQRDKFESFATERLGLTDLDVRRALKVNSCKFEYFLIEPGKNLSDDERRQEVLSAIESFVSVRYWFRVLVISNSKNVSHKTKVPHPELDKVQFGMKFERQVTLTIISALQVGLKQERQRLEEFCTSEVGTTIDMSAYREMMEGATLFWVNALSVVAALLSGASNEEKMHCINVGLGKEFASFDELNSFLKSDHSEDVSVLKSLIGRYIWALEP
ncbi:MAG: SET domain-containing protein-lysine N-methyltransferase [Pseudomonadota bacterium]